MDGILFKMKQYLHFSDFSKLYLGRGLLVFSSNMVMLFLPIFLFIVLGNSESGVFAYFFIGHLLYGLLVPLGAMHLARTGYKRGLIISTFWNTLYFGVLFLLSSTVHTQFSILALLFFSLLSVVMFRVFFWVPYHVEIAELTQTKNRGFAVSSILVLLTVTSVSGPLVGGYLIQQYGFVPLFFLVMVLSLLAALPFYSIQPRKHVYEWTYTQTWVELFRKKHRGLVLALFANGAENAIGIVVWPLFIFTLLNGNFYEVGVVSSLIFVVTVLLQIVSGKHLDKVQGRGAMLHVGSVLSAFGWIAKVFVVTAPQIFIVGLYHNIARIFTDTPVDTMSYDLAADSGHYIDEVTVLREIAIQFGKVVALLFVFILTLFVDIQYTFIIAAIAALLLNALYIKKEYKPIVSRTTSF